MCGFFLCILWCFFFLKGIHGKEIGKFKRDGSFMKGDVFCEDEDQLYLLYFICTLYIFFFWFFLQFEDLLGVVRKVLLVRFQGGYVLFFFCFLIYIS